MGIQRFTHLLFGYILITSIFSCKPRNTAALRASPGGESQDVSGLLSSLEDSLALIEDAMLMQTPSRNDDETSTARFTAEGLSQAIKAPETQLIPLTINPDKNLDFDCEVRDIVCELTVISVEIDYVVQKIQSSNHLINDRTIADGLAQLIPQMNQIAAAAAYKSSPLRNVDDQKAFALTETAVPNIASLVGSIKSVRTSVKSLQSRAAEEDLRIRREEHSKYINTLWQSYQEALREANNYTQSGNKSNAEARKHKTDYNSLLSYYNRGITEGTDMRNGRKVNVYSLMLELNRGANSHQNDADTAYASAKYYKERASQLYKDWQEAQRNYPQK